MVRQLFILVSFGSVSCTEMLSATNAPRSGREGGEDVGTGAVGGGEYRCGACSRCAAPGPLDRMPRGGGPPLHISRGARLQSRRPTVIPSRAVTVCRVSALSLWPLCFVVYILSFKTASQGQEEHIHALERERTN